MGITVEDIVRAFPPGRPWTDKVTGCPPEIIDIERDLRGERWIDVPTAVCNRHNDAYVMLDVEPLAYFLPAFLRAAVEDPKESAAEYLVYFACSRQARHLYMRLEEEQRDVMTGVVAWLLEHDDGYFGSGERERFVARLREWKAG